MIICVYSQKLKKAKLQMQMKTAAGGGSVTKITSASKLAGKLPGAGTGIHQPPKISSGTPGRPPMVKKMRLSVSPFPTPTPGSVSIIKPSLASSAKSKLIDPSDAILSANISKMMSSLPEVDMSQMSSGSKDKDTGASAAAPDGGVLTVQVLKEPPTLPAKLPGLVLNKVLELEQVWLGG